MGPKVILGFVALLACSVILAVIAKSLVEGMAIGGKKPYMYGFGGAILTTIVAYLLVSYEISSNSSNRFEQFWSFGAIAFVFGIMHMLFIHNRFFYLPKKASHSNRVLVGELLFGLGLVLFISIAYSALYYFFSKDRSFTFHPVTLSTLLFFLPMLVFYSFQAAYEIPPAKFPTWSYPLNKDVLPLDIYEKDQEWIIGFEVAEKARDSRKHNFRVKAPDTCQLGTLFYHFVNESNEPGKKTTGIEFLDNSGEPYEWWFYTRRKWYQVRKILNPEFSMRESGIRENTVVVCERILSSKPFSHHIQQHHYER